MPIAESVTQFLQYIASEKQLSSRTVSSYQQALQSFVEFSDHSHYVECDQIGHHDVRRYMAQLHRKGLSTKSIAQKMSALRSFYDYLFRSGQVSDNPAKGVKSPKQEKRLPKVLDVDEVSYFLDRIPDDDFLSCRDKAIMELFYSSGIRLGELQPLQLNDVDFNESIVRVVGKGNKARIVPVGRQAVSILKRWLSFRSLVAESNQYAMFVTEKGKSLQRRSIQARLEYWGVKLGLPGNLHPHKFRHSCATHFLESASDLRAVQELLGHANLSTTQIYTHLDFQHLANAYDAAHPRAKKRK